MLFVGEQYRTASKAYPVIPEPIVTPHVVFPTQPEKKLMPLLHVETDPYVAVTSVRFCVGFRAGHCTAADGKPILQAE